MVFAERADEAELADLGPSVVVVQQSGGVVFYEEVYEQQEVLVDGVVVGADAVDFFVAGEV